MENNEGLNWNSRMGRYFRFQSLNFPFSFMKYIGKKKDERTIEDSVQKGIFNLSNGHMN